MTKRFFWGVAAGSLIFLGFASLAEAQTKPADSGENPTAYTALRLIGKNLGRDALARVVEVTGRDGVPQPFLWKVVLKEGAGSREIDVAGGKIEAQRELTRPPMGTGTVRLADLNLDSSGAFDATNAQARKVKLRYDSLSYDLKVSPTSGKPVWNITLINKAGSEIGTIHLAAHDGTVISTDGRLAYNPPTVTSDPASTAAATTRPAAPPETPRAMYRPPPRETTVTSSTTTVMHKSGPRPAPSNVTGTTTTTTQENIPVAKLSDHSDSDDTDAQNPAGPQEGGLFTRTGRTLDRTSHTVERGVRKAGASVQRFFTGHSDIDQPDQRD